MDRPVDRLPRWLEAQIVSSNIAGYSNQPIYADPNSGRSANNDFTSGEGRHQKKGHIVQNLT
jgi:hypothetical protein